MALRSAASISFTQASFTNWQTDGKNPIALNGMLIAGLINLNLVQNMVIML